MKVVVYKIQVSEPKIANKGYVERKKTETGK